MQQPRRNLIQDGDPNEDEMNRYNLNTRTFRPYSPNDNNLNNSREEAANGRYLEPLQNQANNMDTGRVYVNSYMTNENSNRQNINANPNLNVVENETYFQPNQQRQDFDDQNEREEENDEYDENNDDDDNRREDRVVMRSDEDDEVLVDQNAKKEEFYFQTKIRNTGFWGKVRLRRGTWMAIVGLVLLAISIVVISVFWRWWYGPEVNVPCRVVGITLLVLGFFSFVFGILSNCMMVNDEESKFFIGSPPRKASWILLGSIVALTVASDLITIYYTYWHTRFVNTPQIIVAIILYFFGSIAFIASLIHNFNRMKAEKYRIKYGQEAYIKKYKTKKNNNKSNKNEERNESSSASENENEDENEKVANNTSIDYETRGVNPVRSHNISMNQSVTESETSGRKNFRKGVIKMAPRTVNTQYSIPKYEEN